MFCCSCSSFHFSILWTKQLPLHSSYGVKSSRVFRGGPGLGNLIFRFITLNSSLKSSICILELLHLDAWCFFITRKVLKFISLNNTNTVSFFKLLASWMLCLARHVQSKLQNSVLFVSLRKIISFSCWAIVLSLSCNNEFSQRDCSSCFSLFLVRMATYSFRLAKDFIRSGMSLAQSTWMAMSWVSGWLMLSTAKMRLSLSKIAWTRSWILPSHQLSTLNNIRRTHNTRERNASRKTHLLLREH